MILKVFLAIAFFVIYFILLFSYFMFLLKNAFIILILLLLLMYRYLSFLIILSFLLFLFLFLLKILLLFLLCLFLFITTIPIREICRKSFNLLTSEKTSIRFVVHVCIMYNELDEFKMSIKYS